MSDPLASLARLRRQAVDEARRALLRCVDLEDATERHATAAENAITQELQIASHLSASDHAVERFGVWLRQARSDARAARRQQELASADTARARAALTSARAAAEAVDTLRDQKAAERRGEMLRRAQSELDEMTRHRTKVTRETG